jgi:MFS family permease
VGRAFDAYGPRPLLIAGTVILNLSVFMTSLCKEYWQFILAQGILQGVGIGLVYVDLTSSRCTLLLNRVPGSTPL